LLKLKAIKIQDVMLLWEYHENANNTKGLKVFQQFLTVMPNF